VRGRFGLEQGQMRLSRFRQVCGTVALALGLIFCVRALAADVGLVRSQNSPNSTYADGEFRIAEELLGPDGYEILISDNEQMQNARSLVLPSGTILLKLAPSARPKGHFYWTVEALGKPRGGTESITLINPPPGTVVRARDINLQDNIPLRWTRVPSATSYVINLQIGDDAPTTIEIKGAKADPRIDSKISGDPYHYLKAGTSRTYRWWVEAYLGQKVIATSDHAQFSTEPTAIDALSKQGVSLQRSFTLEQSEKVQKQAATIGMLNEAGSPKSYNTEFALVWNPRRQAKDARDESLFDHTLGASIEARLNSNGSNKNNDAIRARITENLDYAGSVSSWTALSLKYETTRSKDTEKVVGELLYAPTFGIFSRFLPVGKPDYTGVIPPDLIPAVSLRLQPYFGIDAGNNVSVGTSGEQNGTVFRLLGRAKVELSLNSVARALGLRGTMLFIDDSYRYLPLESQVRKHNYLASGVDFSFTDDVALSFRYNVGEDAPVFKESRSFTVNLGLHF
jgi:hypothetical protein